MSGFDNYKYKNIVLSELIHGIQNWSVAFDIKAAFNLHPADIKNSVQPFTDISESPNSVNYKYNGTDIKDYCIAKYNTYSPGTHNNITIPSWCNKIKAVLCGAGGAGGSGTKNTTTTDEYNYHGWRYMWTYGWDYQGFTTHYAASGRAGAGGGGGEFKYVTMAIDSNTTVNVTVGSGGSGDGEDSTMSFGSAVVTAYGGKAANKTTPGAGGEETGSLFEGDDGSDITGAWTSYAGHGGPQPKNKSGYAYGHGGTGYPGNSTTEVAFDSSSESAGSTGNNGYCLVYFIRDE